MWRTWPEKKGLEHPGSVKEVRFHPKSTEYPWKNLKQGGGIPRLGCRMLLPVAAWRTIKSNEDQWGIFQGEGSRSEKGWSKEADAQVGELTNPDSSWALDMEEGNRGEHPDSRTTMVVQANFWSQVHSIMASVFCQMFFIISMKSRDGFPFCRIKIILWAHVPTQS